ncbi:hypothetical protein [Nocardioides sp. P5_E3]
MTDDAEERDETTLGLLARLVDSVPRNVPIPMVVPLATRIAELEHELDEAKSVGHWLWQNLPSVAKHALGDVGEWPWLEEYPEPTTRAELVEFLVGRGVRRARAERWVDMPTSLLSGDVASELITQPGRPRFRAIYAARRHAQYSDPDFWS